MGDTEETECLDSWEDLQETGVLDKRIEKMQITKAQSQLNGISSSHTKVGTVIILNEDVRTRFMPPEPSVKILRRPTNNGCDGNGSLNDNKPKQPIKTLQQREMEYAKARLRILGAARSPEENLEDTRTLEDRIQKIQTKPQILRPPEANVGHCGILRLPKGPDGTPGFNLRR